MTQAVSDELDGGSAALPQLSKDELFELFRRMVRIRAFEERVAMLYREGMIPGFVHLSTGQEASAVGACWSLLPHDIITSTHRGHGHCLAKGLDMTGMIAELMARETGTNGGFGGSMHIADPTQGIFGANGIVGAGLPIALGAALATKLRDDGRVIVSFVGDGAFAQGGVHEALNLASLWRLPLIVFCENNGFAEFSSTDSQHPVSLAERAIGYGISFARVDGNDVADVALTMQDIIASTRSEPRPYIVEATTSRWRGHYEGDPETYRSPDEKDSLRKHDPLVLARQRLMEGGLSEEKLTSVESAAHDEVTSAVEQATAATEPSQISTRFALLSTRQPIVEPAVNPDGDTFRVMDAIHDALEHELESSPDVFIAGIDSGRGGNVFGLTRGLYEIWPDRVMDTPISEAAIMGLAVGSAMAGMRPVVEIMYIDFIGICFDQILNQAAKLRWMTGGRAQMALTVRTQFGAGRSSGSQHSQSLEALLAHIPGLTIVMPATPADTYGLLRAAILDPNPVIFIENRLLYGLRGPRPRADHLVPIGTAAVRRRGSDVTLVTWSRMTQECLKAAVNVAVEGISTEVIELRTIAPWDRETIYESVGKTNRLVIAHEAVADFGVGAEIAASVAHDCFWSLDAPVIRVGAHPTPPPYAPTLERAWLPDADRISKMLRRSARE